MSDDSSPLENAITSCRVCSGPLGHRYVAREMMFGMRDTFEYVECTRCNAVQIAAIPRNLGRYYPQDYYAFSRGRRGLKSFVRKIRHRLTLGTTGIVGSLARRLKPHPAVHWIARTGMTQTSRILDVGCGGGYLLLDLQEAGFRSLTGVDPFVAESRTPAPGVRIIKGGIDDMSGVFDIVMFHHSLEHMPDQHAALAGARRLMADDGWCVVRVPIASSYAWEHYRENWVQLDPPRHIVLHTVNSLRELAGRAGLALAAVEYDSADFQMIGSEMYLRDIPLSKLPGPFSRSERRRFRREAARLNAEGRGDQAVFYFRAAGFPAQ